MLKEISDKAQWNSFLKDTSPDTFLQSWEWGEVQKQTGEDIQRVGHFQGGTLHAIALVVTVNARRGRHYLIPHGPITSNSLTTSEYEIVLHDMISFLSKQSEQTGAVGLRIAPLIEATPESRKIFERAKMRPAPLHVHAERTWKLDIRKSKDQLLADTRKTTRHAIRKAKKANVVCSVITNPEEAIHRFWPLYEQTRERHGFVTWSKKMISAQLQTFAAEGNIFTIIATHDGMDVAAAILPQQHTTVFYYHGASKKLPSSVPAAQLLQWNAICESKNRGAATYNFWGIKPKHADESHPFHGITTFKQGFGGYATTYLHAQDIPFSVRYWKLWTIDMYRKIQRGF